ncbi:MAG: DMT family transporter, partial [Proteobacteria bacterium]|nr:DMT family transporter [Pseudomonadota bacterium]
LAFKEHFRPALSSAILLGFCGVILLLHPTLAQDQLIAGLIGLISGLLAGIAYLNVKQLGLRGEPEWRVVFYFSLIAALSSGIGMLLGTVHPITVPGLLILLGLSSTATLAQLAMTRAYRTGKTLVAGSLSYSTVIFASIFGMILWGEALPLMGWIGMGLIIAGGVLSLKLSPKHGDA